MTTSINGFALSSVSAAAPISQMAHGIGKRHHRAHLLLPNSITFGLHPGSSIRRTLPRSRPSTLLSRHYGIGSVEPKRISGTIGSGPGLAGTHPILSRRCRCVCRGIRIRYGLNCHRVVGILDVVLQSGQHIGKVVKAISKVVIFRDGWMICDSG